MKLACYLASQGTENLFLPAGATVMYVQRTVSKWWHAAPCLFEV